MPSQALFCIMISKFVLDFSTPDFSELGYFDEFAWMSGLNKIINLFKVSQLDADFQRKASLKWKYKQWLVSLLPSKSLLN